MSGSTQSGEPTSKYFVAHLGEATAEVAARLLQWAAGCVAHSLLRDELNHVSLYFERAEARTVRQMQSLLRTLSAKWKPTFFLKLPFQEWSDYLSQSKPTMTD